MPVKGAAGHSEGLSGVQMAVTTPNSIDALHKEFLPEHRLWFAVLQQALLDYKEAGYHGDKSAAAHWFRSDEVYPGSFLWICDIFDCSPSMIRAELAGTRIRTAFKKAALLLENGAQQEARKRPEMAEA